MGGEGSGTQVDADGFAALTRAPGRIDRRWRLEAWALRWLFTGPLIHISVVQWEQEEPCGPPAVGAVEQEEES
jgi:hypothetical protein